MSVFCGSFSPDFLVDRKILPIVTAQGVIGVVSNLVNKYGVVSGDMVIGYNTPERLDLENGVTLWGLCEAPALYPQSPVVTITSEPQYNTPSIGTVSPW